MKYKSIFLLLTSFIFTLSFVNAQTVLYVRGHEGQFVQKVSFNETSLGESFKINFYCSYINIFRNQKCVSEKDFNLLNNLTLPTIDTTSSLAVSNATENTVQTKVEQIDPIPPVQSSTPQVIYQVIERAVPGPQGPAGRDGVDGRDGTNNTLASFFPNISTGAEYLGYGSGSANNPTGDGSLSSLNVSGDSTFSGKISGAGLLSCNTLASKILYNSTSGQFECGTDQGGSGFSGGDITAQNVFATSSLQTPILFASTTNATTSNAIYFVNSFATITNATSTNLFSNVLTALTSTFTNIIFTNATGTNATTTNFFTTNLNSLGNFILGIGTISSTTITNANVHNLSVNLATVTSGTATDWYVEDFNAVNASNTNLFATNATFSYATVTNGFFTNLSVTGPVSAALSNGYIFRGGTNNISEATSTLFVADSGKVGVGSSTPSEKLSVEGNLLVSGNIVSPKFSNLNDTDGSSDERMLCFNSLSNSVVVDNNGNCYGYMNANYSDIKLKTNIATVTSVLDKVSQLTTVNFNWIDEKRGTTTQLGYIAQDVEKVFPEVVREDNNGFLKVNYLSLSAIYANAIKELLLKVIGIDSRVERLEARMTDLENKLNGQNSFNNQPIVPIPETPPVPPTTPPENPTETQVLPPTNLTNTPETTPTENQ